MNQTKYLLDNNVLGFLGPKRRASGFFAEHCRIPHDVAHEARFFAYAKALAPVTHATTPAILEQLVAVMKTVPVGHTKLIDLYANKGAADPVLVATALALNNPAEPSLFADSWVIVTHDKEVTAKAQELSIKTETPGNLAAAIDQSLT
jgi:hypothetical protein